MDAGLDGRVALVTGAGGGAEGGIGAGVARVLARAGATLAINDVSAESAEATVSEIRSAGGQASSFVGDIADPVAVDELFGALRSELARLDVLVNNAGVMDFAPIEQTPGTAWNSLLEVNLAGAFYATKNALPMLRASDAGRIVFVSSLAGIRISTIGGAAYTASKAGLLGLMRHTAAEAARDGVTANAVLPGAVATPLLFRHAPGIPGEELFADVPLGRGADVEEIGQLVAFLASDHASYITGAEIVIDGGRSVLPGSVQTRHRTGNP